MNEALRPPANDPGFEAENLLIKTFELSGLIKPLDEVTTPMEHTGLLPHEDSDGTPVYPDVISDGTLVERIDQNSLDDLYRTEEEINPIQQQIDRLINLRRSYTDEDISALISYRRKKLQQEGLPKEAEILRALMGGTPKEGVVPIETSREGGDLASDVLWMIHREVNEPHSEVRVNAA